MASLRSLFLTVPDLALCLAAVAALAGLGLVTGEWLGRRRLRGRALQVLGYEQVGDTPLWRSLRYVVITGLGVLAMLALATATMAAGDVEPTRLPNPTALPAPTAGAVVIELDQDGARIVMPGGQLEIHLVMEPPTPITPTAAAVQPPTVTASGAQPGPVAIWPIVWE
jgi:hypothetical protein